MQRMPMRPPGGVGPVQGGPIGGVSPGPGPGGVGPGQPQPGPQQFRMRPPGSPVTYPGGSPAHQTQFGGTAMSPMGRPPSIGSPATDGRAVTPQSPRTPSQPTTPDPVYQQQQQQQFVPGQQQQQPQLQQPQGGGGGGNGNMAPFADPDATANGGGGLRGGWGRFIGLKGGAPVIPPPTGGGPPPPPAPQPVGGGQTQQQSTVSVTAVTSAPTAVSHESTITLPQTSDAVVNINPSTTLTKVVDSSSAGAAASTGSASSSVAVGTSVPQREVLSVTTVPAASAGRVTYTSNFPNQIIHYLDPRLGPQIEAIGKLKSKSRFKVKIRKCFENLTLDGVFYPIFYFGLSADCKLAVQQAFK